MDFEASDRPGSDSIHGIVHKKFLAPGKIGVRKKRGFWWACQKNQAIKPLIRSLAVFFK
jgi:hypothetical protein